VLASGSPVAPLLRSFRSFLGGSPMMAYLAMMAVRLIEMHRVLAATGSVFLHCDPTASPYLRILLDAVFTPERFVNEIIWRRTTPKGLAFTRFASNHDVILYHRKSEEYIWKAQYIPAQDRPRLILVGYNARLFPGLEWTPPRPTQSVPLTVRSVIGKLREPKYWERGLDPSSIPVHPNHWCMVPKSKNFTTRGALVQGTARGRSFRTLDWTQPSPTVAYGNREVHVHPSGRRRLSVYEALLLQGFPPEYELLGTLSAQISQVSEAVPPPLAQAVAASIRQDIERHRRVSREAA
jgi:hypothetical protein